MVKTTILGHSVRQDGKNKAGALVGIETALMAFKTAILRLE